MFLWDSILGAGKSLLNSVSTVGKGVAGLVSSGQANIAGTTQAVGAPYGTFQWFANNGMASVAPSNYNYKTVVGNSSKTDTSYLTSVNDFFNTFAKGAADYVSTKVFGKPTLPVGEAPVSTPKIVVKDNVTQVPADNTLQRFFNGLIGTQPAQTVDTTGFKQTQSTNFMPYILAGVGVLAVTLIASRRR